MRVCDVELSPVKQPWGANGCFPSPDARVLNRQGQENIGASERVVIEEIVSDSPEVVDLETPIANRYRDAELALFVAFSVQREEAEASLESEVEQGAGNCFERRRLVVAAV